MKLWAGRFGKATDSLVDDFHSSISFDQRLYEQDITGSIAHATMLGEQGIIPQEDAERIVEGLKGILADATAGEAQGLECGQRAQQGARRMVWLRQSDWVKCRRHLWRGG